jgi:hypothetical protein
MSIFSKILGPTEEELHCGLCSDQDMMVSEELRQVKRQRKSRSSKAVESHQKFTEENLFKKRKESQAFLTTLAFKPCCSKNC